MPFISLALFYKTHGVKHKNINLKEASDEINIIILQLFIYSRLG